MRTIIAVMLVSSLALADPPKDAPVCSEESGRSMLLEAGSIVPFRATCIDEHEHVRRECINERNVGELDKAHESWLIKKPVFVALVVAIAVVSAGVAAGVVYAADRSGPRPNP